MKKKYNIRSTSLLAYVEVLENLGEKQQRVYEAILNLRSCNNKMIANHLNLQINSVTPRVNELKKMGIIMQDKIDNCPITLGEEGKKRNTIFWRVVRRI